MNELPVPKPFVWFFAREYVSNETQRQCIDATQVVAVTEWGNASTALYFRDDKKIGANPRVVVDGSVAEVLAILSEARRPDQPAQAYAGQNPPLQAIARALERLTTILEPRWRP